MPLLQSFTTWLDAIRPTLLPKNPMTQAVGYATTHREALMRYTTEGFLKIDNNLAERILRTVAIGRKNCKRPVKTLIDGEFIVVSSPPSLIGENPYHGSTHASRPAPRATLATTPSGLENLRPVPFAVRSHSPTLGPYL